MVAVSNKTMASTNPPDITLEQAAELASFDNELVLLGVRHHSPACARMVKETIERLKPAAVLLEGPSDYQDLDALLTPQLKPPVALFSFVSYPHGALEALGTDGQEEADPEELPEGLKQRTRVSGWYPFCDYSPEWVGLLTARKKNIPISFCDLSLHQRCAVDRTLANKLQKGTKDLFERTHATHATWLTHLQGKLRAKDEDDVWDQLFELTPKPPEALAQGLAAFGLALRASYSPETLALTGDRQREHQMAAAARDAVATHKGKVLLICGAFHMQGIAEAYAKKQDPPAIVPLPEDAQKGIYLVPYDFKRMQRLRYAAGIPMPAWYQAKWEEGPDAWLKMLTKIARSARKDSRLRIGTAALAAASEQASRLAHFRGHPTPSRSDVLDAIQSCWVKGDIETGHGRVMNTVQELLCGDKKGSIGRRMKDPPLVQEIEALLETYHLKADDKPREVKLRPVRVKRDKERAQILMRLKYLQTGYAHLLKGPNFLTGEDLQRIEQTWLLHMTPEVRSEWLACSVYGATLEEAVKEKLRERIVATSSRSMEAAQRLLESCALGIQELLGPLLRQLSHKIDEDAQLLSVIGSLHRLLLLYKYRDAMGAVALPQLGLLLRKSWQRSLWLLGQLVRTNETNEDEMIKGLQSLNHAVHALPTLLEVGDFYELLAQLRPGLRDVPGLHGAVEALLWRVGRCTTAEIGQSARAHFAEHHTDAPGRYIEGLLHLARRAYLDDPELIDELSDALTEMLEADFRQSLPRLRRAHTQLTPAETNRLAEHIAHRYGLQPLALTHLAFSPEQLMQLQDTQTKVQKALAPWGWQSDTEELPSSFVQDAMALRNEETHAPAVRPMDHTALRRWRLILGRYASPFPTLVEGADAPYQADDATLDRVLSFLYDREYQEHGREQRELTPQRRAAGSGPSQLTVPSWINQLRELFPRETYEHLEAEALSRYGLHELVTQADVLERCTPSMSLLEAIMKLKSMMSPDVLRSAKRIVAQVAESVKELLMTEMKRALSGKVKHGHPVRTGPSRSFDAKTTIKRNLKHYDTKRKALIVQQPWFRHYVRQFTDWRVIICVDQSGSMLSSTIHASIIASIFATIPELHTHLVVFDTEVVDLTEVCEDPVETLLSVQLGGGTDIAKALGYCNELVDQPSKTILVLITDLYEGGDVQLLLARFQRFLESGVKCLVLAALNEKGEPDYDRNLGRKLVKMGGDVGAMTPMKLVQWLGEVLG